jgi:hypothetical protein
MATVYVDGGHTPEGYTNFSGLSLPNEGARSQTFLLPLIELGTSADPLNIGTASVPLLDIQADSSLTAGNVVASQVLGTMLVADSDNTIELFRVVLSSAVQVGNWANAILGKIDFTAAAGRVTGLTSPICSELDMPDQAAIATGSYFCFEAELNFRTSTTIGGGTHAGFFVLNAWGDGVAAFDTDGVLFELTGVTKGSGKLFQDNTAGAASQALKIRIGSTLYYIMLTSTGA